jgi:hypothetical protein
MSGWTNVPWTNITTSNIRTSGPPYGVITSNSNKNVGYNRRKQVYCAEMKSNMVNFQGTALSSVVTAGALHCWKAVIILQSSSNVVTVLANRKLLRVTGHGRWLMCCQVYQMFVTAWANRRLLRVSSYSRVRGAPSEAIPDSLDPLAVAPGSQGWLQARGQNQVIAVLVTAQYIIWIQHDFQPFKPYSN